MSISFTMQHCLGLGLLAMVDFPVLPCLLRVSFLDPSTLFSFSFPYPPSLLSFSFPYPPCLLSFIFPDPPNLLSSIFFILQTLDLLMLRFSFFPLPLAFAIILRLCFFVWFLQVSFFLQVTSIFQLPRLFSSQLQ